MKILIAILLFSVPAFGQDVTIFDHETYTWKTVYVERADKFAPQNDFFQPQNNCIGCQLPETFEVYDEDTGETYIFEKD